jgi:hypothetical protein
MKLAILTLSVLALAIPVAAHAAKALPAPDPAAVAPNGNNEDASAAAILRGRSDRDVSYRLNASAEDSGQRVMTKNADSTLHSGAPVPGNQSGPGLKATQYND